MYISGDQITLSYLGPDRPDYSPFKEDSNGTPSLFLPDI